MMTWVGRLVVSLLVVGCLAGAMPGGAAAESRWLEPVTVDPDGALLAGPAVTARGETLALESGTNGPVGLLVKQPGAAAFDTPIELASQGADVGRLAIAPDGSAAVVWAGADGIEGAVRAPDGTLSPVHTLATGALVHVSPIATNSAGTFAVAFLVAAGGERQGMAAVGSPGDGFGTAHELGVGGALVAPTVAVDDDGDATASYAEPIALGGPWRCHAARQLGGVWHPTQTLALGCAMLDVGPDGDAVAITGDASDNTIHVYSSAAGEEAFAEQVFAAQYPAAPLFAQVDAGGHAIVAWTDGFENPPTEHARLVTAERKDAAASFGDRRETVLPDNPLVWSFVQNHRGDFVALLNTERDFAHATMVWRTGRSSYGVQTLDALPDAGLMQLLLDEEGNADAQIAKIGPGAAFWRADAYWRAADAPAFSTMRVPFPFAFSGPFQIPVFVPKIALNDGNMLIAGRQNDVMWAQRGSVADGFDPPAQATTVNVGPPVGAAIHDQADATILSQNDASLVATVFGPPPPSPPPPAPPSPSPPGTSSSTGSSTQASETTTTGTPPPGTTITPGSEPAHVARAGHAATVAGNTVVLRLACAADGPDCDGTATIIASPPAAAARPARTLARGRYAVPAGATRRVRLRLTATGRRMLRDRRHLAARLQLRDRTGRLLRSSRLVVRVR